jgi:hypothetical protein
VILDDIDATYECGNTIDDAYFAVIAVVDPLNYAAQGPAGFC